MLCDQDVKDPITNVISTSCWKLETNWTNHIASWNGLEWKRNNL